MTKHLASLIILLLIPVSLLSQKSSAELSRFINSIENQEGYDRTRYPLGLFTEEYYRKKAEFAQAKLKELKTIDPEGLSETEKISKELMRFRLQEEVDHYKYKAYLNPLLSDAGFHVSLPYQVRPLNNYAEVKRYLKKLEAVP